ncbi:MAG: B12-binding domain-containing radical SAM protein, partial [Candidatus Omnitrophica bacterium]|nr:B12-binding domain-containing radical SAM protein [Candidatus Omnitrophota bacterium]
MSTLSSAVIVRPFALKQKRYKHALFLNPYIENSGTSVMGIFPPTGLEYVAASAEPYVDKITVLDLRYETELCDTDKLREFILSSGIDIICVTIGWDRQYDEILDLLNSLPPEIPLVVGGYKATEQVDDLFEKCPGIDLIVRGEGEETIREILGGSSPEDILGISYRRGAEIEHNANRPLSDVDTIFPPNRSLRRNKYRIKLSGMNISDMTFDSVLSARGCPFTCKFCTFSLNPLGQKRKYSERSVVSVVDEIEKIDASTILFSDDNFFTNVKRAAAICDMIIARKIKKRFIAQARIEIAKDTELLKKMVKAGFKVLFMGIESPHDRILEGMDKGFDSREIRECFDVLRKYPIYYHGYFIYGNIGETEEEMLYIAKFAREIGLDSITFQKLRIEKYSMLRKLAESTAGYHVTARGELFSDKYSHAALKKI